MGGRGGAREEGWDRGRESGGIGGRGGAGEEGWNRDEETPICSDRVQNRNLFD